MAPAQMQYSVSVWGRECLNFFPIESQSASHYLKGNQISKIVMSVNIIKHCASSTLHIYENKTHTGINLTPPDSQPLETTYMDRDLPNTIIPLPVAVCNEYHLLWEPIFLILCQKRKLTIGPCRCALSDS